MIFARTMHLLSSERARGNAIALGLVVILLGLWGVWLATGKVTVQTVAKGARFEAEDPPLAVQPLVAGLVQFSDLRLGREVKEGDILVKLDTKDLELKKKDQTDALHGAEQALLALQDQLVSEEKARDAAKDVASQTSAAGMATAKMAGVQSENAKKQAEMVAAQLAANVASKFEELQRRGDSERTRAEYAAAVQRAVLEASSGRSQVMDRDTRIAALRLSLVTSRTARDHMRNELETTEHEISKRTITATISGTLAEISPLAPGQNLAAGARVATIVPPTKLRVVASFSPEEAVGRVKTGQHVVLRVDNYPWAQYGTVDAVVDQVASESRDGMIRAEMHVSKENPQIPLMHGLTTQAEVDVERVSPLGLLLRMAGQMSAPARAPVPPPNPEKASGILPAR